MLKLQYYYDFHGILKVRSNLDLWFNYFKVDKCDYDLDIKLLKDFNIKTNEYKKIGLYYYGIENGNLIYLENKIGGFRTRALLKNLQGKTELLMNKAYYYTRLPISFHDFINSLLQLKFLIKGYSLLHSACISYKDEGVLISAFADTGKTTTVLRCLKNNSTCYLSDDFIILDGKGYAYCLPRLINYRTLKFAGYLNKKSKNLFQMGKLRTILTEIPFISAYLGPIDAKDIYKALDVSIKDKIKITKAFIIENSQQRWKKINKTLAFQKILYINKSELGRLSDMIYMYFYLNSKKDLNDLLNLEENILSEVVKNSNCYLIESRNPNYFSEIIYSILKNDSNDNTNIIHQV